MAQDDTNGPNMVSNGSFEDGSSGWALPAELYAPDDSVARAGSHSLRYRNEPGGPYLLAGQELPLRAGRYYRMRVWVKTEGIVSTDTGATISLEWVGEQGYVGGAYPPGIEGTSDWQEIVFETGPLPDRITGGHVIVYGRQDTSGTAWFDDVEVTEVPGPLARFRFTDSPFGEERHTVLSGVREPRVRVEGELLRRPPIAVSDLRITGRFHGLGTTGQLPARAFEGPNAALLVRTSDLPFGETPLDVMLATRSTRRPLFQVRLQLVKRPRVRLDVVEPNPAGVLGVQAERAQQVAARVVFDGGSDPGCGYRVQLYSEVPGVPRILLAARDLDSSRRWRLTFPAGRLSPGLSDLVCDISPGGESEPIAQARAVLTRADSAARPASATWLGPNRMLMVNDEPFLPIGFYMLSSLETVFPADQPYRWQGDQLYPGYYLPILDRLASSHFNCIIDYGSTIAGLEPTREVMDAAHERGLRAIFSVKDLMPGAFWRVFSRNLPWTDLREANRNVVEALREHPALIAWYINDEVGWGEHWQGAVNVFRDTRATDPWHPTYAVHYDYQRVAAYRQACDVIGTDPYALLGDINFTARSWRASRQQMPPEQPLWAVVQCFGPGYELSRPSESREPTFEEERAATFAAIAEGGTGIIYYCYHSLQRSPRFEERFAELDLIAGEVLDLLPVIQLPDARRQARVTTGDISLLTKKAPDALYLILASTLREDQDVVITLPRHPREARNWLGAGPVEVEGKTIALQLAALDARVLEVR